MNKKSLSALLSGSAEAGVIVVGYLLAVLGAAWGIEWLLSL